MGFQLGFPALRFYPPSGVTYDADAQAMFNKRAAFGDEPTEAYKAVISDYVEEIKSVSGLWDSIIQLVVMAGATTISGACQSIKGNNLTPINMVNGDVGIKTGVKGNGTNKYLQTGYSGNPSGTGRDNFHAYGHFTEAVTKTAGSWALFGSGGTAAGRRLIVQNADLGETAWRLNGSNATTITSLSAGDHAFSRGSSSSYTSLIAGTLTTHTDASVVASNGPHYILARGPNTGSTPDLLSNARVLIWALGANVNLADYETPRANLITALNAI